MPELQPFTIREDDLSGPEIQALLHEHLAFAARTTRPESRHALPLEKLRQPGITFWTVWHGGTLCGCGALKELHARHGEIKSMRTATASLRRGVASRVLEHVVAVARRRGYRRLSLEMGSQEAFAPARALYARFGFTPCGPFASYREDRSSVFLALDLDD